MLFEKIHLETDEKIIKMVRKHWFWLFKRMFGLILTALAPLIAWIALLNLDTTIGTISFDISNYTTYFIFAYSLWLLVSWMSLAYVWTDYYLDIWAITDRRIIAIDQVALFRRSVGSFRLEKLQDMNIEINGLLATLLHYGSIEAQTASGSEEEFQAQDLPNPRELKAIILQAADERMKKQSNSFQQDT